jgi:RNA polymerase sigma-70 factor (ECF subfamily)
MSFVSQSGDHPEVLLARARSGDQAALGQLLELYRNYLRLQARTLIGSALRVRLDPSDLVQETFLEAHRDFGQFLGSTEAELVAWLRQVLVRNLADQAKRQQSQKRDVRREESLEALLERSSSDVQQALVKGLSTPSSQARRREQAVVLADALAALPPHYREVIILRHLERLKFEEVGARMGRSSGAVRILWTRALERLNRLLEGPA